jgi:hypothetical protein
VEVYTIAGYPVHNCQLIFIIITCTWRYSKFALFLDIASWHIWREPRCNCFEHRGIYLRNRNVVHKVSILAEYFGLGKCWPVPDKCDLNVFLQTCSEPSGQRLYIADWHLKSNTFCNKGVHSNKGSFPGGVNPPGRETGDPPPTSTEIMKTWIYTSTPPYVLMAQCGWLVKYGENFTCEVSNKVKLSP